MMQEEFELRDLPYSLQIAKVVVQNPRGDFPKPAAVKPLLSFEKRLWETPEAQQIVDAAIGLGE